MNRILFRLIDQYAPASSLDVLEAGSGTGYLTSLLEDRYRWRVHAVDISPDGLKYSKSRGLARLVQGDVRSLPFAPGHFDALLSMDVLIHLEPGQEFLAASEFARVLRRGGFLFLRVSALDVLRSRHSMFAHERQRFSRSRLIQTFEQSGIEVLRCTYANSLLMPVALAKFRLWEPLTRAEPASGVGPVPAWLDSFLFQPFRAEASWIGTGGNFPLGQSLFLVGRKRGVGQQVAGHHRSD